MSALEISNVFINHLSFFNYASLYNKRMKEIKVRHEGTLLEYLINDLHYSRNVAKKILSNKVEVNGTATSKFDYKLNVGDAMVIEIVLRRVTWILSMRMMTLFVLISPLVC